MTTIDRIISLALAAALAAAPGLAPAQALQRERVPGVIPAAELWADVLANDDFATVMSGYDALGPLYDEQGEFTTAPCQAQGEALAKALLDNPVSLALWDAGYRCAQATGDAALAEKRLLALQALLEHAMTTKPADGRATPIRVVAEADAMTLVEATGGSLLYSYYDVATLPRALTLVMAVVDRDGERETAFAFDYLDTMVALQRKEPASVFPTFRRAFAMRLLELLADQTPGSSAAEALARQRASELPPAERVAAYRGLADSGNYGAIIAFARHCLSEGGSGLPCATDAVDLLLPLAERNFTEALVMLALANEHGRGVKRDTKAAAALLAAAEARSGRDAPIALMAMECAERPKSCPSAMTRKRIDVLLAAGEPMAQAVAAAQRITARQRADAKALAWLRGAAEQGLPMAQTLLGLQLETEEPAEALRWWNRAARHQAPGALAGLARLHETGRGVAKDEKRALDLRRRAAALGDVRSMIEIADHTFKEMHAKGLDEARRTELRDIHAEWLIGAGTQGHVGAQLQLAALFASDDAPEGRTREHAEQIYRALAAEGNVRARVELARFLRLDEGTPEKLAEARKLLGADAKAGNAGAQAALGYILLSMDGHAALQKEGRAMLRRAAASGDATAIQTLANALARGIGGPADVREARKLWISVEDQPTHALNDRAWFECTAPAAAGFNPKSGAEAARRMREKDPQPSYLDTIASCEAANGDFDAAVRTQEQAIAATEARRKPPEDVLKRMRERLELYRKRERYVETSAM